jgi:uncharacterized protein (DUF1786 family)
LKLCRQATQAGEDLLLTGVTMGGGPCAWAASDHLKASYQVFATPKTARTFNDDLEEVAAMGVQIVNDDEVSSLAGVRHLQMLDFDYEALGRAFGAFGVDLGRTDVLAVAVFDHGNAPPGVSDRLFRFEYLAERIRAGAGLVGFAFPADDIPASMTRLQAVAATAPADRPLLVMDTAPAAVLGALEDPTSAPTGRPSSPTWATCTPWRSTYEMAKSPGCSSITPACSTGPSWRGCWPNWRPVPSRTRRSLPSTATARWCSIRRRRRWALWP